jgi:hypothetical protein
VVLTSGTEEAVPLAAGIALELDLPAGSLLSVIALPISAGSAFPV